MGGGWSLRNNITVLKKKSLELRRVAGDHGSLRGFQQCLMRGVVYDFNRCHKAVAGMRRARSLGREPDNFSSIDTLYHDGIGSLYVRAT